MCIKRWLTCAALAAAITLGWTGLSFASSPTLTTIQPRGVKVGGEYTLSFIGSRLGNAEEIFLYDSGVTVLGIERVHKDNNRIKVKIKVDPDCRIGEHVAQVRTINGI